MFEPQTIRSEHKDVIHDVAYDYYGLRMATCSSDHTVKVHILAGVRKFAGNLLANLYSNIFRTIIGLGQKRKRLLDGDGQLESAFRFGVASQLGTSGIRTNFGHLLVRSYRIGVGRNGWRKNHSNHDTGQKMVSQSNTCRFPYKCYRRQIRTQASGSPIGLLFG